MKLNSIFILLLASLLCIEAQAQDNPYGIYPVPHLAQITTQTVSLTDTVCITAEDGIDQYTIDRAVQVLEEHGKIPLTPSDSPVEVEDCNVSILRLGVQPSLATRGKYDRHDIAIRRQEGTELAEIIIVGENTDATFYGLASLEQILDQNGDNIVCGEIQDYADVKNRGIIEGYYGVPYSSEVSQDLFRFMARYKMNMYMYGAKSDPYHSQKWADPYPTSITSQQRQLGYLSQRMLRDITKTAHQCKVNFIWAIHPGSAFTNASNTDVVSKIMTKFNNMYRLGVRQFGLCVDDVSIPTDEAVQKLNADRVTELQNLIDQKWNTEGAAPDDTVKPLNVVPQLYNFSQSNETNRQKFYAALAATPSKVDVYITGTKTWTVPNSSDLQKGKDYLGREVSWWWNYPCNDQDVTKLFPMDTYTNFSIHRRIDGSSRLEPHLRDAKTILINPMQQGEVSKIALFSVGNYTWNTAAFNNIASWEAALQAVVGQEHAALRLLAPYLSYYDSSVFSALSSRFKAALEGGKAPTEEMMAEIRGILDACANLHTLETSERESDRLFYDDVRPWLLKLEAMAREIVRLSELVVTPDDDAKWENFVEEKNYVDGLPADERFAYNILTGMGSSIRLSTRYPEPAAEAMMPFVEWFSRNALGKGYFTNLSPSSASFIGSRQDMDGSVSLTSSGSAYIRLPKPVVMYPGDYVGISLPWAARLENFAVADTLREHYEILCSANGKRWTEMKKDMTFPTEHIKYILVINPTAEARTLTLSSSELKLTLYQKLKALSATTPECSAGFYDGHTEKYLIDGNYDTWTCIRRNQADGDAYTVKLRRAVPVHDVRICMGTENGDYMTAAQVQLSTDGNNWESIPISGTTDTNYTLENEHNVKYSDEMTYMDFDGQGKAARYVRLYLTTPNTSRWLRLYEIEVNGRLYEEAYQGPAVDDSDMTIPELADADGATCFVPQAGRGEVIWHFRSLQHVNSFTIYQDGGRKTDATVSITMDGEEWEELGNLTGYVCRFDLTSYSMAEAVKISWKSKAPLLYEISEETDDETNTITGIETIQNEDSLTPFRGNIFDLSGRLLPLKGAGGSVIYDLSGRSISAEANSSLFTLHSSLKKGIYIAPGGKKIVLSGK